MMRDLPALPALVESLRDALAADAAVILDEGEWPAAGLAFDGHLALLVRDHRHAVTLSLPHSTSFTVRTADELRASRPAIAAALAAYRRAPVRASIADAVAAIAPVLARAGTGLVVRIPGTPVPSETWLARGDAQVGLFQEASDVRVVVWVADAMHGRTFHRGQDMGELGAWIDARLLEQARAAVAAAEAEAHRRALPVLTLDEVLDKLRAGVRFRTGGGRYTETFFHDGGRLRREVQDEGWNETHDVDERALAEAIARTPDAFRS